MPSFVEPRNPTKLQEMPSTSPSKTIFVEEIFQDINKQMLKTNNTLNLGQLIKITPNLKKYLWQKLKIDKPYMKTKAINEKTTTSIILDISATMAIKNHMVVIQV
jgi:hypothetical protein